MKQQPSLLWVLSTAILTQLLGCDDTGASNKIDPSHSHHSSKGKSTQTEGFTVTLPANIDPKNLTGLDVTMRAVRADTQEPIFVDFRVSSSDENSGPQSKTPVAIGSYTLFRPLRQGDTVTASIEAPPADSWLLTKNGAKAVLHFETKAGNPGRAKPDIELQILEVKPYSAKKN